MTRPPGHSDSGPGKGAWRKRPLTEGEKALARRVFGDHLRLETIRFVGSPRPFDRAFVAGRWFGREWIAWPAATLAEDYSTEKLSRRATLVHELVHVWQAQQGVNLAWAKIRAGDRADAYGYAADDDCKWTGLNIEQQAMVVEHAFKLSQGGTAPAARVLLSIDHAVSVWAGSGGDGGLKARIHAAVCLHLERA